MKKTYLAQILQDEPVIFSNIAEGDTIEFEMPSFCSGDYLATVYGDANGLYINTSDNYFEGCRDFGIIKSQTT